MPVDTAAGQPYVLEPVDPRELADPPAPPPSVGVVLGTNLAYEAVSLSTAQVVQDVGTLIRQFTAVSTAAVAVATEKLLEAAAKKDVDGMKDWTTAVGDLTANLDGRDAGRVSLLVRGALVNLTNPKGLVFLLAVLPQFVVPAAPLPLQSVRGQLSWGVQGAEANGLPPAVGTPTAEIKAPAPAEAATEAEAEAGTESEAEAAANDTSAPGPGDGEDSDEQVKVVGPLRISIPLFNIYLNEADEQSRRLVTDLSEWALESERHPVSDTAVALAHSLAGNSGTVGYTELSELARALDGRATLTRTDDVNLGLRARHSCGAGTRASKSTQTRGSWRQSY